MNLFTYVQLLKKLTKCGTCQTKLDDDTSGMPMGMWFIPGTITCRVLQCDIQCDSGVLVSGVLVPCIPATTNERNLCPVFNQTI